MDPQHVFHIKGQSAWNPRRLCRASLVCLDGCDRSSAKRGFPCYSGHHERDAWKAPTIHQNNTGRQRIIDNILQKQNDCISCSKGFTGFSHRRFTLELLSTEETVPMIIFDSESFFSSTTLVKCEIIFNNFNCFINFHLTRFIISLNKCLFRCLDDVNSCGPARRMILVSPEINKLTCGNTGWMFLCLTL